MDLPQILIIAVIVGVVALLYKKGWNLRSLRANLTFFENFILNLYFLLIGLMVLGSVFALVQGGGSLEGFLMILVYVTLAMFLLGFFSICTALAVVYYLYIRFKGRVINKYQTGFFFLNLLYTVTVVVVYLIKMNYQ